MSKHQQGDFFSFSFFHAIQAKSMKEEQQQQL